MKFILTLILSLFVHSSVCANDIKDLYIVDIDGIGESKLSVIKSDQQFEWWVEMGDKMVLAADPDVAIQETNFSIVSKMKNVDVTHLAFQTLGHCDHSGLDEVFHENLDALYTNNSSQLIDVSQFENKKQVYAHDSVTEFEKNTVLSYQYTNRTHQNQLNRNQQTQDLVNQVNADRWMSQVDYLSSLDRMLEADLIIAGEWLEDKFNQLGLQTSRVSLNNNYRGFNILGFKQGTSRADDWFVVGAHLDSRNQTWNDSQPSPGAEDNASGCSGVLEVANVLSQYETEASIYFMCFIEEESGLLGSKDVVTYLTNNGDIDKVKTMLNMDMISYRFPGRNVAIAGTNTTLYQNLAETVAANGELYSDIDWQISTNMCCTDFLSFSTPSVGIPAVTSNQPDISSYFGYHTVNDLPENLDKELGAGIVKANLATLIDFVGVDFDSGDTIFSHGFE
ncbi:MAG: M28 family metallopeptidase [Marinicellaceae bacterium]